MHDATVGGIVGRQEIVFVARTTIDVAVSNEETCTLQVHVGIDVDPRIATDFHTAGCVLLDSKLVELWHVIRCIVLGEVGDTTTQLNTEHTGNLELQEQVRPDVEVG